MRSTRLPAPSTTPVCTAEGAPVDDGDKEVTTSAIELRAECDEADAEAEEDADGAADEIEDEAGAVDIELELGV